LWPAGGVRQGADRCWAAGWVLLFEAEVGLLGEVGVERRRVVVVLLVGCVLAQLLVVAPMARAAEGVTDPASAPVLCDSDAIEGESVGTADIAGPYYALIDVPPGGALDFSASGELYPSNYVSAGRGEYQIFIEVRDASTDQLLHDDWKHKALDIQWSDWHWVQFSGMSFDQWTNTSSTERRVLVKNWSDRSYAGGGLRWSLALSVTGPGARACESGRDASETFGDNDSFPGQDESAGKTDCSVDTRTGNEHFCLLSELRIPGRGPGLAFDLAYNSLDADYNGPLGHGWRHSYDMQLTADADGTRTVVQERGATVTFQPNGTSWSAPGRMNARLSENTDGTWTFERNRFEFFDFDASGALTAIRDLNGYQTSLVHGAGGLLDHVEDEAGRRLDFTWLNGRISSITDPRSVGDGGARSLSFSYDASGDLTGYTDIGGGAWVMTYDAQHRLVTARPPGHTDPSKVYEYHYDSEGRVDWEEDPAGRRTEIHYDSPVAGATRIVFPDGEQRVDWYNQDGQRRKVTHGYSTAEETSV
jgi:YD repeat-containing protein